MSEENFVRLFPGATGLPVLPDRHCVADRDGFSCWKIVLSDFGFDVVPTAERLANFHRVENTYLSTFQMLGGLGLLLGTLGMAAVLLRNVLERRRELALLRAVGYNSRPLHAHGRCGECVAAFVWFADRLLLRVVGHRSGVSFASRAIAGSNSGSAAGGGFIVRIDCFDHCNVGRFAFAVAAGAESGIRSVRRLRRPSEECRMHRTGSASLTVAVFWLNHRAICSVICVICG